MAWTISLDKPVAGQLADASGSKTVHVECDVTVDDETAPDVKGYVYDEGATPDADPPGGAEVIMVNGGMGNGPYDCSGNVDLDDVSGGLTKETLKNLTIRVWAGHEVAGEFETKKSRDRTLWGYLPDTEI